MKAELERLARFGLVGVTNTLLTIMTFLVLTHLGLAAAGASALGFAAGAANGYLLNRSWTFRSPVHGLGPVARYVGVQGVGAALSAVGVGVLTGAVALGRLDAEVLIIPPVTLITYILSRRIVFMVVEPLA